MQKTNISENEVDEGAGKNALIGLAALASLVMSASAKPSRSVRTKSHPAPIVQNANRVGMYGGFRRDKAENIVARTIYREAQGEGRLGMEMVATVIFNRAGGRPTDMPGACKRPEIFSCWNKMTSDEWVPSKFAKREYAGPEWEYAKALAKTLVGGGFSPLGTYTHYYANRGPYAIDTPYWAVGAKGRQLENHIFFTSEEIKRVEPMNRRNAK